MAIFDNTGLEETPYARTRYYFKEPYEDLLENFLYGWGDVFFEYGGNAFIIQWFDTRWVICDPTVVDKDGKTLIRFDGCSDTIQFFETPIDFFGNKSIHEMYDELKWFNT